MATGDFLFSRFDMTALDSGQRSSTAGEFISSVLSGQVPDSPVNYGLSEGIGSLLTIKSENYTPIIESPIYENGNYRTPKIALNPPDKIGLSLEVTYGVGYTSTSQSISFYYTDGNSPELSAYRFAFFYQRIYESISILSVENLGLLMFLNKAQTSGDKTQQVDVFGMYCFREDSPSIKLANSMGGPYIHTHPSVFFTGPSYSASPYTFNTTNTSTSLKTIPQINLLHPNGLSSLGTLSPSYLVPPTLDYSNLTKRQYTGYFSGPSYKNSEGESIGYFNPIVLSNLQEPMEGYAGYLGNDSHLLYWYYPEEADKAGLILFEPVELLNVPEPGLYLLYPQWLRSSSDVEHSMYVAVQIRKGVL